MWGFLLFTHISDDTRLCAATYGFYNRFILFIQFQCVVESFGFVCVLISWQQQWNNKTSVASQRSYWFWKQYIRCAAVANKQVNVVFEGGEHGKIGGFHITLRTNQNKYFDGLVDQ